MSQFIWILVLAAIASVASAQTPANPLPKTLIVTHKLPEFGDLKRKTFEQQVIQLALEKTQHKVGAFEMVPERSKNAGKNKGAHHARHTI